MQGLCWGGCAGGLCRGVVQGEGGNPTKLRGGAPSTPSPPPKGVGNPHRITHELSSWRPCLTLANGGHRNHYRHCRWWQRSNLSHQMVCSPKQRLQAHLSPTTIPHPHTGLPMTYPQTGDLYRRNLNPKEIILVIRMTVSKRLVKTQHLTDPTRNGWRGIEDLRHNWELLTKDNK